ncbi:hypothetical protein AGOR_G00197630 [Albula goreensis]|uniref:Small acidic protein-like domain-containing protein n=1 Tax=Albula goreensis TaxID=1534307 RepID=A0A8T3CVH5_9TELE|nr:hypothetical protein AGOR_G00197630 [Albula goreensis]
MGDTNTEGKEEDNDNTGGKKKKKKTSKDPAEEVTEESAAKILNGQEGEEEPKKKKKKKNKADLAGSVEQPGAQEVAAPQSKSSEEITEPAATAEKKKRKRTAKQEESVQEAAETKEEKKSASEEGEAEAIPAVNGKGKKGKKKKNSADGGSRPEEKDEAGGAEGEVEETMPQKKKKKKEKKGEGEGVDSKPDTTSMQGEVVFVSEKHGNKDEIKIDQARRQALQMDIDRESYPKASECCSVLHFANLSIFPLNQNLGQWGTAHFESASQQQKFLRLMGGFKKSSQPVGSSGGRANMALGREGQDVLQQGLLGEFERAQNRRMDFQNKGAGLGFTPPSNKKFSIDINASRSVRFDD